MMPEQNKFIMQRSFFAGMLIGIGALINTRCTNQFIGAFLFSFGLLAILNMEGLLYTGRIGYFNLKDDIRYQIGQYIEILLCNMIGVLSIAMLSINTNSQVFLTKLSHNMLHTFTSSILCGIMMYLAVELWRNKKCNLYVIRAIMIFVLGGFDHCIANMYYWGINPVQACQPRAILFFIVNITGNTIGSLLMRYISSNK